MGGQAMDWRSHVEHIQSGGHWSFETLDEMLAFLRRQAQDPGMLAQSDDSSPSGSDTVGEGDR